MMLPCVQELSPLFSPELKQMFQYHDKQVPYLYVILDQVCQHRQCPHHMFKYTLKRRGVTYPAFKENAYSRSHANCMCILERGAKLEEISSLYGLDHTRIGNELTRILGKLRLKNNQKGGKLDEK